STHGTYLLIPMFQRVKAGMLNLPTQITLVKENNATSIIDGGNGLGQLAARKAMCISIEKAKKYGIALTLVRNTNNISFLGYYSNFAAQEGMIGFVGCNAASSMAPWGSSEAFLGANPISISIPAKNKKSIVMDMSSSVVARGKIRKASRNKEEIPLGWAIDKEGNPTTDPNEALKGTLLPIAGPKGSALAIIVDIIAGVLSGSRFGLEVKTFHELEGATGVGAFCMAIDIKKFYDLDCFCSMVDSYICSIKNLKKVKNVSEVYLPGELEFISEQKSRKEGIKLDSKITESLNDILEKLGSNLKLVHD
ncbi:MAG: Ldh family oxidoreductase, partial [Actinobacteria bacterium]|nr:Ldh family oxidoreductase [Actinomycetota bacterium]